MIMLSHNKLKMAIKYTFLPAELHAAQRAGI